MKILNPAVKYELSMEKSEPWLILSIQECETDSLRNYPLELGITHGMVQCRCTSLDWESQWGPCVISEV